MSRLAVCQSSDELKQFVERVLRDVVTYSSCANRKTVMVSDVVLALRKQGNTTLYGFEVR
jgi:histone H3/H4